MQRFAIKDKIGIMARYVLVTATFSFLGWLYEVCFVYVYAGRFENCGFFRLPFCPIYGISLSVTYFLLGTPHQPRGILKGVENKALRYVLYLAFAFLIPTVAELLVGWYFHSQHSLRLWSYRNIAMNYRGYVALPVSLVWAVLIFLVMRFLYLPIKDLVFRLPKGIAVSLALTFLLAVAIDFIGQFSRL